MMQRAKAYCSKYKGIFDVTVGPLSNLWGFSEDKEIVLPEDSTIKRLDKLVDYKDIDINKTDTTVFLRKKS